MHRSEAGGRGPARHKHCTPRRLPALEPRSQTPESPVGAGLGISVASGARPGPADDRLTRSTANPVLEPLVAVPGRSIPRPTCRSCSEPTRSLTTCQRLAVGDPYIAFWPKLGMGTTTLVARCCTTQIPEGHRLHLEAEEVGPSRRRGDKLDRVIFAR